MNTITAETCIAALSFAAMSRRAALQTELGVGFAIFLTNNGADRAARQVLTEAYANAGNACLAYKDADYKTVNRRVNATADLFNRIGIKTVKKWAGKHNDEQLIAAMVEGLRPYELWTINDVQQFANPALKTQRTPAPTEAPTAVTPHTDILGGPATNNTGHQKVVNMFRRATDEVAKGADHIETEHIAVMIPKAATPDEIVEMAYKLLAMAQMRRAVTVPAEPVPA